MRHGDAQKLLDEFIDGNLAGSWSDEFERHLQECADCRRDVSQLRELRRQAVALPDSLQPERDLWPHIADAIGGKARPAFAWRPLAAAAAILILVVLSAIAIRQPAGPGTGSAEVLTLDEPDPATVAVLAALEAECNAGTVPVPACFSGDEEQPQERSILDLIDHNLRIIDLAIADAREAWSADPGSPHLARLLASAYRAKAALQQQHTELAIRI